MEDARRVLRRGRRGGQRRGAGTREGDIGGVNRGIVCWTQEQAQPDLEFHSVGRGGKVLTKEWQLACENGSDRRDRRTADGPARLPRVALQGSGLNWARNKEPRIVPSRRGESEAREAQCGWVGISEGSLASPWRDCLAQAWLDLTHIVQGLERFRQPEWPKNRQVPIWSMLLGGR